MEPFLSQPHLFSSPALIGQRYIIRIKLEPTSIHIPVELIVKLPYYNEELFIFVDKKGNRYEGSYQSILCEEFSIPDHILNIAKEMQKAPFEKIKWGGRKQDNKDEENQTKFAMGKFNTFDALCREINRRSSLKKPLPGSSERSDWMDPKLTSFAITRWYNSMCARFCEAYITSRPNVTANPNKYDRKVDFTMDVDGDKYSYDCKGSVWPKGWRGAKLSKVIDYPYFFLRFLYSGASSGNRDDQGNRFYLVFKEQKRDNDLLLKRDPYLIAFFIDSFFKNFSVNDLLKIPVPTWKMVNKKEEEKEKEKEVNVIEEDDHNVITDAIVEEDVVDEVIANNKDQVDEKESEEWVREYGKDNTVDMCVIFVNHYASNIATQFSKNEVSF